MVLSSLILWQFIFMCENKLISLFQGNYFFYASFFFHSVSLMKKRIIPVKIRKIKMWKKKVSKWFCVCVNFECKNILKTISLMEIKRKKTNLSLHQSNRGTFYWRRFLFHMCKLFFPLGFTKQKSQILLKNSIIFFSVETKWFHTREKSPPPHILSQMEKKLRNLKYHVFFLFTWFHKWKRKMENGHQKKTLFTDVWK